MTLVDTFRRLLLDRLVLRPTRHPLEPGTGQRVTLTAVGLPLECLVHRRGPASPELDLLLLKFPGTAGRAERSTAFPLSAYAAMFPQPPLAGEVWTWNPPGYGNSGGRATLPGIAEAALDFVREVIARRAGAATRVILCGNSLGCAPALHAASRDLLPASRSGLILRNPPPVVPVVRRIARRYPLGRLLDPVAESVCDTMNVLVTAASVELPVVFLQSECDTLVPRELQSQVHASHPGPQRVVTLEGLEHDGIPDDTHQAAIADALRWLWHRIEPPANSIET